MSGAGMYSGSGGFDRMDETSSDPFEGTTAREGSVDRLMASGSGGSSEMPSAPGLTGRPSSLTGVTDTSPDLSTAAGGSGAQGGVGSSGMSGGSAMSGGMGGSGGANGSGGSGGSGGGSAKQAAEQGKEVAQEAKETAKQTVQETKEAALETAQQIKGDVQAQVGEVAGEAKQQATELMSQAKEQATTAFTKQQEQAVGGLGSLADALRQTAKQLKEGDDGAQAGIGQFVEDAADRLAQSADFLRDKEPAQLLHDVQDFARKQPMAFVGAAFGIGLVAARLMKSGGGGSAQIDQMVGSLSQGATQAMDAVKERVSDMTGSSEGSEQSGQSGQAGGATGAASFSGGGSTASSPASGSGAGGFSRMNETASEFELGQSLGDAGTISGTTTGTPGYGTGGSAGYSPEVPGLSGIDDTEGRS